MKPIPLIVIGSEQTNAYMGSVNYWCSCITAACGMGTNTDDIEDNL